MSPIIFMCGIATGSVVATGVAMLLDYFAERLRIKREREELNPELNTDQFTQPSQDTDSEPQGDGPLFGLHPPEGCVFEVSRDRGITSPSGEGYLAPSWVVKIVSSDPETPAIYGYEGMSSMRWVGAESRWRLKSDEELIIECAKSALSKYATREQKCSAIKTYSGTYPPKDTRNI